MAAAEPIRDKKQVKHLAQYYLRRGQLRNYILVVMGVHTALRISDLLRLRWRDVYDFDSNTFRSHIQVTEKKTGKSKIIAINKQASDALQLYFSTLGTPDTERFLFQTVRRKPAPISRIQAYRVLRAAAEAVGIAIRVSCHSLRKTFGYHAWKSGVHAAVIMDIYNHSSLAITRRYLGVCQDDRDTVYLAMNFI